MARKKLKKIYNYECTLTKEKFKLTAQADHPEELVSVRAYYEMHPDMDDRPEKIKRQIEAEEPNLSDFDELGEQ